MNEVTEFKQYRSTEIAEMRPAVPNDAMDGTISVSLTDKANGSPRPGDMIARNPKNHADRWLVAAQYFADNFAPMPSGSDKFKEVSAELDAAIDAELSEHTSIMTDETDTQAAMGHKAHK